MATTSDQKRQERAFVSYAFIGAAAVFVVAILVGAL
jgi:hypothetical protein